MIFFFAISPTPLQLLCNIMFTFSYRQAQATVLEALPLLNKHGISTKRPDDYFAEMAKSDQHMQKVNVYILVNFLLFKKQQLLNKTIMLMFLSVQIRKKLLAKQSSIEKSEKAKKLREQRKFGKKVGTTLYFSFSWECGFLN